MSIFSKIFGKKQTSETDETVRVGGMEDFMTLIRVYYQSVMAAQLGISNINFLPDMAVFKRTLKIPTQNNKLGIAERSKCKKMLSDIYGLNDVFFKEIDNSIYFINISATILIQMNTISSFIALFSKYLFSFLSSSNPFSIQQPENHL